MLHTDQLKHDDLDPPDHYRHPNQPFIDNDYYDEEEDDM